MNKFQEFVLYVLMILLLIAMGTMVYEFVTR